MRRQNIEMLEIVAQGLKYLLPDVVFVGGASTVLYIDTRAAPEPRPTDDVDCVTEVASRLEYQEMEEKLRALGFSNYSGPDAPLCRWVYSGITVDVMPTDEKIIGFTNRWYLEGIRYKERRSLPSGREIGVFSLPYLIASKLEAYKSRGNGDPRTSADIEDIIFVLDGNSDPFGSIQTGSIDVREYLAREIGELLDNRDFLEAIEGVLTVEGVSRAARAKAIIERIANRNP